MESYPGENGLAPVGIVTGSISIKNTEGVEEWTKVAMLPQPFEVILPGIFFTTKFCGPATLRSFEWDQTQDIWSGDFSVINQWEKIRKPTWVFNLLILWVVFYICLLLENFF